MPSPDELEQMGKLQEEFKRQILGEIQPIRCATFNPALQTKITPETRERMDKDSELAQLRLKVGWLHALCGEILACLRVNIERGCLTTENDQEFSKWIDRWEKRWREI